MATVTTLSTALAPAQGNAAGVTTFTVHVTPVPEESATPQAAKASVTFVDTDSEGQVRSLGSSLVAADGAATLAVALLSPGAHSVRAVYNGTATSAASTSAPADITAQAAAAPDFSITATPTTLDLDAGVQGTVAVSITPINGFNNYVSLSCAGLPLSSTCNFLPSNVPVNGTTAACAQDPSSAQCIVPSTMTLNTQAFSGNHTSLRQDTGLVYAFLLPGALGLVGLGFSRHRGLRTLALFCVVGSLVGGASSCAQRYRYLNYPPAANEGTPNGQSIIRIYGTSVTGAIATARCFQITLNVKSANTTGSSGNITTPCS